MRWHPKDESKWEKHFALIPVETRCGSTVWMETVWKRLKYPEYRPLGLSSGVYTAYEYVVFEERPDIIDDGEGNAPV